MPQPSRRSSWIQNSLQRFGSQRSLNSVSSSRHGTSRDSSRKGFTGGANTTTTTTTTTILPLTAPPAAPSTASTSASLPQIQASAPTVENLLPLLTPVETRTPSSSAPIHAISPMSAGTNHSTGTNSINSLSNENMNINHSNTNIVNGIMIATGESKLNDTNDVVVMNNNSNSNSNNQIQSTTNNSNNINSRSTTPIGATPAATSTTTNQTPSSTKTNNRRNRGLGRKIRRPFRSVGRRRTGGRKNSEKEDEEGGDADLLEEGEGMDENAPAYGTMIAVSDGDDGQSQTSNDLVAIQRESSSRPTNQSRAMNNIPGGGGMRKSSRSIMSASADASVVAAARAAVGSVGGSNGGPAMTVIDPDWPVHYMERFMRQILLVCVAYILGAKHPEWLSYVGRTTEYAVTAWGTCVGILILALIQKNYPHMVGTTDRSQLSAGGENDERAPLLPHPTTEVDGGYLGHHMTPTSKSRSLSGSRGLHQIHQISRNVPETPMRDVEIPLAGSTDDSVDMAGEGDGRVASTAAESVRAEPELPHPSLGCFYLMDTESGKRIYPNAAKPARVSTDWFEMDMLMIVRTPDVDDPGQPTGTSSNNKMVDYLRGKQRRFELQMQTKVKRLPKNQSVYFTCELEKAIKMGMIQRAFVGAAMAFVKSTNPSFHYSVTGTKDKDGSIEKPHMSFTVEGCLDRLVITKPGETPPKLGESIHEDPESIKWRKKGGKIKWNTEDTYTMALWSAYVDFLDWKVLNLPGIRPFGLRSVLGMQPINMGLYLIDNDRGNDKHYRKDITPIITFEFSNNDDGELGPCAARWNQDHGNRNIIRRLDSMDSPVKQSHRNSTEDPEKIVAPADSHVPLKVDEEAEEADDADEDAETAAELGEGIYLRSGDTVVLREYIPMEGDENNAQGGAGAGAGSGPSTNVPPSPAAHSPPLTLANGGGFAVLQEQDVTIVIEKARRLRRNRLIKSGDTVMFKMLQKEGDETKTKYLSIHRGWWLKWVSSVPTKNGYFTIYTHETEFPDKDYKSARSTETQSVFLTVGGSFTLKHKRWSSYRVGVAGDPSPTYGGRMLGLYNPKKQRSGHASSDEQYHSDEGIDEADIDGVGDVDNKTKASWMMPLVLCAHDPSTLQNYSPLSPKGGESEDTVLANPPAYYSPNNLIFSRDHAQADVPAWIEMMNRTQRIRQLTYVVRVVKRTPAAGKDDKKRDDGDIGGGGGGDEVDVEKPETFVRLRTGRELAQVMRTGQSMRNSFMTVGKRGGGGGGNQRSQSLSDQAISQGRNNMLRHSFVEGAASAKRENVLTLSPSISERKSNDTPHGGVGSLLLDQSVRDGYTSEPESLMTNDEDSIGEESDDDAPTGSRISHVSEESGESCESDGDSSSSESERELRPMRRRRGAGGGGRGGRGAMRKGKSIIGKVGKAAKNVSMKTGKAAVRQSRNLAKGTVNAGKAVIGPISRKSKKPPKAEPKIKRQEFREKDPRQVAVAKPMKKIARKEAKINRPPTFLAGELCAPEQSCRTASSVLQRMSNVPYMSPMWQKFNDIMCANFQAEAEQDRWFLEGSAVQLGVTPSSSDRSRGYLVHESLVARCLWESHWREEWCGMYESCLSFYSPLTKSSCLEIAFIDITNVRPLDPGYLSPLPGFPLLVLETAWLCHYVAFRDEEARDTFGERVEEAIENHIKQVEESASMQESDLRKARFWQGFQSLSGTSVSSGSSKWAKVSSNQKRKERTVLNTRRMAFDAVGAMEKVSNGFHFVEDLLSTALSFSLESLEQDPESFVKFLDLTSQLRSLPLEEIDLTSPHSFCLFTNIYHCLLQQALLLSVDGPLHRKSIGHFMRTSCYEIGGDVFSLSELYTCVLRGRMGRPSSTKSPYIEPPRKSNAYRFYALDFNDARMNFVVNTADVACPPTVPVLRASDLDHQLNVAAATYLKEELAVDAKRRLVILPKICEVFKNDFGGDSMSCLRFCMGLLDEGASSILRVMMMDEGNLSVRYQHTADQFHTALRYREFSPSLPLDSTSMRETFRSHTHSSME